MGVALHDANRKETWQRDKDVLLVTVHRGDFETRRRVRDAYEAGFDAGCVVQEVITNEGDYSIERF